ncbi:MAG TPA: lipoate--protein ligase family protein [Gemmataceae bacterium]|jgi:lipoate-protein ligase A|nr:lipoate--protein ligase family protein [Gemmataceae bacterium]
MPDLVCVDLSASSVNENLALDEAMLLAAEAGEGPEVLRFWEWPTPAVVLGAGGSITIDVNEMACRRDDVTLHRRASGGGTVLLGRGCLLFSLVLAYERAAELREVNASYRWILGRIRVALQPIAVLEPIGISDLAWNGLKVSGNSQQRKAGHVLHHGTLLYDFDLPAVGRYLYPPEREPTYRAGRGHDDFVTNLPTDAATIKNLLGEAFICSPLAPREDCRPDPEAGNHPLDEAGLANLSRSERATKKLQLIMQRVPALLAEKYARDDWVRRR